MHRNDADNNLDDGNEVDTDIRRIVYSLMWKVWFLMLDQTLVVEFDILMCKKEERSCDIGAGDSNLYTKKRVPTTVSEYPAGQ